MRFAKNLNRDKLIYLVFHLSAVWGGILGRPRTTSLVSVAVLGLLRSPPPSRNFFVARFAPNKSYKPLCKTLKRNKQKYLVVLFMGPTFSLCAYRLKCAYMQKNQLGQHRCCRFSAWDTVSLARRPPTRLQARKRCPPCALVSRA